MPPRNRTGSGGGGISGASPEAELAERLTGRRLTVVERSDFDWIFSFGDRLTLGTESPWRILVEGRIALSSGDLTDSDPAEAEAAVRDLLARKRIQEMSIRPDSGDLTLVFESRTVLEVLNLSAGYEAWTCCADGLQVTALGGGEVALLREE